MSTVGVGASGILGWEAETTSGTYIAPTKFGLIRSESLNYMQESNKRRPLRGIADIAGLIPGNVRVEGDVSIEVTPSQIPLLMKGMRGSVVKTGASAPFTYTFTPSAIALPAKTLSFTVVRNGAVFGFTGCLVSAHSWTVEDGMLVATFSILGRDEAVAAAPTPTYTLDNPFGMGEYTIEIPTATQVFDTDTFTVSVDDGAEAQYRLKSAGARGAQFVKFGERTVEVTMERDFFNRTEFDAFKALTAQTITIKAIKSASETIEFLIPAAIKDAYEITGLTGQADLIRASITYMGVYNAATSKSFELKVVTAESVVFP